ncbi:MAG: 4-alpha-glucanotransferase [Elusimicrobia bacterium]|nr:4-alpha-glucanotransferase [Elusimicrobiota bacterium]
MQQHKTYHAFLKSPSRRQWKKIGLHRRAGVTVPLFSLYSSTSVGIGELKDLTHLADWCKATGISIIQLLPLNDVGYDFMPYSARTSFALDPMYLSLENVRGVNVRGFEKRIDQLRREFPSGGPRVNYGIKGAKMAVLWDMFQNRRRGDGDRSRFEQYRRENRFWLDDYALFKALKEKYQHKSWEEWDDDFRYKKEEPVDALRKERAESLLFHEWLQWQMYEQFKVVKRYAAKQDVLLMGDLPFLVSRDSADVWAHQDDFKLDLSSGAPPDLYFAAGQRWGMPPYNWERIAQKDFDYLKAKLQYAQNFYDLFRVDHIIGVFRLFTIPLSESPESGGSKGRYDPPDEGRWEEHGRNLLKLMLHVTDMLPCGEDLGTVPPCSYKVLEELAIPGLDVQRWTKDWGHSYEFKPPESYRKNGMAIVSTHDMSTFPAWWKYEAGTIDEALFRKKCESRGISFDAVKDRLFDFSKSYHGRLRWKKDVRSQQDLAYTLGRREEELADFIDMFKGSHDERDRYWNYLGLKGEPEDEASPALIKRALEACGETACIFSVQLIQDYLSLGHFWDCEPYDCRINFPGIVDGKNWSFVVPVPVEEMASLPVNRIIKEINRKTNRI